MERDIAMSASWAPQQYQLVLEFEGGETKAIELFGARGTAACAPAVSATDAVGHVLSGKNPLHGVSGVIARATGHTNVRIQCVNADGSALQDDVAEVAGLLGRRARVLFDGLEAVSINDGQVLDLAAPSATRSVARGYLYMAGGVAFVGSAIALWLARLG